MLYLVAFLVGVIVLAVAWAYLRRRSVRAPGQGRLRVLPAQFIVADIETTGLDPAKHEIIEIAAIRVNRDSDLHDTFQALVKPQRRVPSKITMLTGITDEMVRSHGEPIEEVMQEFLEFVGDRQLVFYNAAFDMGFLVLAARRASREIDNPVACTLMMAREAWPGLPSYSLANLCRLAERPTDGSHRALKDCELTMTIYAAAASVLGRTSQQQQHADRADRPLGGLGSALPPGTGAA